MKRQVPVAGLLSLSQVIGWGSSYYAFPVLAGMMAPDLGVSRGMAFTAFSGALLASALAAVPVGRWLDRLGGRKVMSLGAVLLAAAFLLLALARGPLTLWGASLLMGVAMSMTLYEAAFASVVQAGGSNPRRTITVITLAGGFASTLFWPGTAALNEYLGWRDTYLVLAGLQIAVCLPVHLLLPGQYSRQEPVPTTTAPALPAWRNPRFWLVGLAFSSASLVSSGVSLHLLGLLAAVGQTPANAIWLAALVGPSQVVGRVIDMLAADRLNPRHWTLAITGAIPAAFLILAAGSGAMASIIAFIAIYGISNGLMTIVRGTLPLELFGASGYGKVTGLLAAPSQLSKALGPFSLAMAMDQTTAINQVILTLFAVSLIAPLALAIAIRNPTLTKSLANIEASPQRRALLDDPVEQIR
jgi:predicted MFS family arabinose efflux permease